LRWVGSNFYTLSCARTRRVTGKSILRRGRHQTTPYCRNRRWHCARAGLLERACPCSSRGIYAVWSSSTGTTISTSQHSEAVAARWLKGFSGCRRVKFAVECRVNRRSALFSTCLVRVLRASSRKTKNWLDFNIVANFSKSSSDASNSGSVSHTRSSGARFSIRLLRKGSDKGSCRKFARDYPGQVAARVFTFFVLVLWNGCRSEGKKKFEIGSLVGYVLVLHVEQRVRGRLEDLKPMTVRVDGSRDLEVFLTDIRFRVRNLDQRVVRSVLMYQWFCSYTVVSLEIIFFSHNFGD